MSRITSDPRTVRQLLQGRKFGIEEYQREYKWELREIEELIQDLYGRFAASFDPAHERQAVANYDDYFLGFIILSRRHGKDYIVDGQQRVTSLTLLLIYLYHLQNQISPPHPTRLDDLIFSTQFGSRSYNLDVPDRAACLEALYLHDGQADLPQDPDESVRNMIARYEDIKQQLPDDLRGAALPYFVDWLLERVQLVEMSADTDDDAYTIFETMNDRGRPLTPTDMLKGYLVTNISQPEERVQANALWKERTLELIDLGKDEESDFIKHWLRAKYAQTIRERKRGSVNQDFEQIGTAYHKWVRDRRQLIGLSTPADFKAFIHVRYARFSREYLRLRRAAQTFTPGLETVFYNAHNDFTLQYPLLLAPLRETDDETTTLRKIRVMATYLDIYIARRAVNYLTLNYSAVMYGVFSLMREVRDQELPELVSILHRRLQGMECDFSGTADGDREGVQDFALNQWSKRYIHHILARMTAHVEVQSGMPNHFPDYISREIRKPYEIEHIWADKYERHEDEFAHEHWFQRHRNRLGGLLLLPRGFNQSYGDLPYEEKREHYLTQNLLARSLHEQCYQRNPAFNQYIQASGLPFRSHPRFKKADLDARQQLYQRLCEEIWSPERLDREANS
jgi:uncharacterized protein DUF262/uncharacterized protein DUF1524